MSLGNLVLGRTKGQSVVMGEGEHTVKMTVVDAIRCTVNFQAPQNATIRMIDSKTTEVITNGQKIHVVTIMTTGRIVKFAFQADKCVSIDREEIRLTKLK